MNFLSRQFARTLLSVAIISLSACGGGGSTDLVVSKPGQSLYSTAPSQLTMKIGDSNSYKIGGGGNGSAFTSYTVTTSNPNVVSLTSKDSDFKLTALAAGSANVTIQDSSGNNISLKVTVDGSSSLKVLAPEAVTLKPSSSDTYQITGGIAPYTVSVSNQGVAKAVVNANSITINAIQTGGAQVIVFDSKGNTSSIVVNVKDESVVDAPLFTTAPSFVNMVIDGGMQVFKIGGGRGPYSVTSSAPSVVDVVTLDNSFTIVPKKLGFGVVYVTDSLGKSVSIQAIVNNGKDSIAFYSSANNTITVPVGGSTSYELFGGSSPYTVTSSNSSVATVSLVGSKFTVTAKEKGTSSIVAKDSLGAVVTIALTVPDNQIPVTPIPFFSTAPGSVVIQPGVTSTFNISGGTAPYQVSSSNTSVSTVSITGTTLSITGSQVGTSTVLVKDATGATINVAVTVPSATSGQVSTVLYTTAPPAVVVKVGTPETYVVSGGKAPYVATSSDTSILQSSTSNDGKFTLTGVAAGNVNVVIVDSNGANVTLAVTTKL